MPFLITRTTEYANHAKRSTTSPTRLMALGICLSAVFFGPRVVRAEVRCASLFGDHMVLQRGMPVPVWGWAAPGEKVTVSFNGQIKSTTADSKGSWSVRLDSLIVGSPGDFTVSGANTLKFTDVLVGEVWLCSGQSNMELYLKKVMNADQELAAANHPDIRLAQIKKVHSATIQTTCSTSWTRCTSDTAATFSAVAYFLGRHLNEKLSVPIGLIDSSYGATSAEAWTSRDALASDPDLETTLKFAAKYPDNYPTLVSKYEENLKEYNKQIAARKDIATTIPAPTPMPNRPLKPAGNFRLATVLYNAMIAPLAPFAIRGAAWYQGENNAPKAWQYRKLLPAMIGSWRKAWGEGDFTFLIVQLPNFEQPRDPARETWAELREAQALTARNVPNCGLAVTIDIGEAKEIHPKNKQEVGRRLALLAEKLAYGRDVDCFSPEFKSMAVVDGKVRISFDHAGAGLQTRNGGAPAGFTIAGDDHKFQPAKAKIEGGEVIVSSYAVPKPVAVRYAWSNNPTCDLSSKSGLPVAPFRTDAWPLRTINEK